MTPVTFGCDGRHVRPERWRARLYDCTFGWCPNCVLLEVENRQSSKNAKISENLGVALAFLAPWRLIDRCRADNTELGHHPSMTHVFFRVRTGYIAQFGIPGHPTIAEVWKGQAIPDDPVRQSNNV